jgi:hypothetical protein
VLVFFIFLAVAFGFYLVWMGRRAWIRRRERRRERMVARTIRAFVGSRVEAATRTLGPPAGVFEGTTGRSLYIWRPPREGAIPSGDGLVLVSMVVSADGDVADATWRIIRETATL